MLILPDDWWKGESRRTSRRGCALGSVPESVLSGAKKGERARSASKRVREGTREVVASGDATSSSRKLPWRSASRTRLFKGCCICPRSCLPPARALLATAYKFLRSQRFSGHFPRPLTGCAVQQKAPHFWRSLVRAGRVEMRDYLHFMIITLSVRCPVVAIPGSCLGFTPVGASSGN